jgi:hypothetical protein
MKYKSSLNFAILGIIVVIIIHMLCRQINVDNFEDTNYSQKMQRFIDVEGMEDVNEFAEEQINNEVEKKVYNDVNEFAEEEINHEVENEVYNDESKEIANNIMPYNYPRGCSTIVSASQGNRVNVDTDSSTMKCKISHTDNAVHDYIWGSLLGRVRPDPPAKLTTCPKQMPENALEEHLRVRNITHQSSHQQDTVDKINMLQTANNNDVARGYQGKKIGELYDQLTKGPTLYNRTSTRMPKFDTAIEKGYYDVNGPQEFSLKRKHTNYKNEHSSNGGPIKNGLYGNDPNMSSYSPIKN